MGDQSDNCREVPSFRALIVEALPESARRPRNRFIDNAQRGLILSCEERRQHGHHHRRDQ